MASVSHKLRLHLISLRQAGAVHLTPSGGGRGGRSVGEAFSDTENITAVYRVGDKKRSMSLLSAVGLKSEKERKWAKGNEKERIEAERSNKEREGENMFKRKRLGFITKLPIISPTNPRYIFASYLNSNAIV